jgi:lipid-A-disaccharide synthase
LRARGIKVIYFIPPQIWASRPWRLRKLKCSADEVLVILPFEESYYRKNGIAAEFVGNPLASHLPPASSKAHMAERFGIDASRTLIGLFPGSRKLEIRNLLGPQIAAAKRLNAQFPDRFSVALSRAKNLKASFFDEMLRNAGANDLPWLKIVDDNHALLSASDLVLAASGTLTLEATLYGTPMVVMYRGPWYAYALVKLLMSVDHAALPNNLEEPPGAAPSESDHSDDVRSRRIVPELWQYEVTGERIADEALAVLEPARYSRMKHDIARVARQFHDVQTPLRVARAIVRMARDGQTAPTP